MPEPALAYVLKISKTISIINNEVKKKKKNKIKEKKSKTIKKNTKTIEKKEKK